MSAIDVMRDEYPGDQPWMNFLNALRTSTVTGDESFMLPKDLGDEEIASVLKILMGQSAKRWFNQPCKALEGRIPSEVYVNEPLGKQIIRSLLMRMPG